MIIALTLLITITPSANATITDNMPADGVLGQSLFGVPSFTRGYADNAGSSANAIGMHQPRSVVLDTANKRLFVADTGNYRVLIFNLNSQNMPIDMEADYVLGQPDFTTRNYVATQDGARSMFALAYDPDRQWLFAADGTNSRVLVYDVNSITNGEDAIHVLGQDDFTTSTAAVTQAGM